MKWLARLTFFVTYVFCCIVLGLLIGLTLVSNAHAFCTMPAPANPGPAQPQLPNVAHKCWPARWGLPFLTGQGYIEQDIAAVPGATVEGGRCGAWWCQAADGTWSAESHCSLASYTAGGLAAGVTAALAAPDPVAALQAFADHYAVTLTDPQQINDYNCLHIGIQQQVQATKPGAPTWKVIPNGSAVYPVSATGKLGLALAGRRAAGGTACNCAKPIVQYGFTYCAFDGGAANEAAACVKQ